MIFKDLKNGYPVYLLDRTALRYEQGKVTATGMPHADLQPGNYGRMIVDVTVRTDDGKQSTYAVSDGEQTAYAGSLMIACTKECVVNEVRAIKAQADEAIAKVDEMRKMSDGCGRLLEELDTDFKDRQATEKRFRKIDERFGSMEEKMDRILAAISGK